MTTANENLARIDAGLEQFVTWDGRRDDAPSPTVADPGTWTSPSGHTASSYSSTTMAASRSDSGIGPWPYTTSQTSRQEFAGQRPHRGPVHSRPEADGRGLTGRQPNEDRAPGSSVAVPDVGNNRHSRSRGSLHHRRVHRRDAARSTAVGDTLPFSARPRLAPAA
jgi:hypothetical protein